MSSGFPALTPTYGLGSSGRTGVAINISSPRTKLGSQGRIYAWYRARGQGQYYEQLLINSLGIKGYTHDQNMSVNSDADVQLPTSLLGILLEAFLYKSDNIINYIINKLLYNYFI